MAKYSNHDKISKMMTMLRGLQHPAIQQGLARHGFDQEDFDEGWHLMDAAMGRSFAFVKPALPKNLLNEVIPEIDRWENTHFDVADAALKRRYPTVHAELFQNLTKMSGNEVLLSVTTFVNRYEALSARTGDTDKAAVALLHKRGITPDSVAGVKALLEKARNIRSSDLPAPDPEKVRQMDKAVEEMWAWYQDWAQIARVALPNKRLRIHLGISTANTSKPEEPETPAAG
ncbi:hypothetical protein KKC22_12220 [Myxococcota bacterium]|nr:hypothetical protein [Myxococcota bacterium]